MLNSIDIFQKGDAIRYRYTKNHSASWDELNIEIVIWMLLQLVITKYGGMATIAQLIHAGICYTMCCLWNSFIPQFII